MKQRLNHLKKLSIEHQTEYKNFENNFQLFQFDVDKSKQTIPALLMQLTVEDIRTIDVSSSPSKIFDLNKILNRRFTGMPVFLSFFNDKKKD